MIRLNGAIMKKYWLLLFPIGIAASFFIAKQSKHSSKANKNSGHDLNNNNGKDNKIADDNIKSPGREEVFEAAVQTNNDIKGTNLNHQCTGYTKSGSRCRREALPNSEFCWQHQD